MVPSNGARLALVCDVARRLGVRIAGLRPVGRQGRLAREGYVRRRFGPIHRSLLAHWRFDETAGAAVVDSSGVATTGSFSATGPHPPRCGRPAIWEAPWRSTERLSCAFRTRAIGISFKRPNAFTVVGWVMRQTPVIGWNSVVSRQYQRTTWEHFELSFKDDRVVSVASSQIDADWYCTAPSPTASGLWTHIAGTYDGTTVRGYENGIEVCNLAFSATLVADDTGVVIGGQDNTADQTVNQFFTGLVDDMAIYQPCHGPRRDRRDRRRQADRAVAIGDLSTGQCESEPSASRRDRSVDD